MAGGRGGAVGCPDETTVLTNWRAVTDAVLGAVTCSFQAGDETIAVASGSAVGPSALVVSGRRS